MYATVADMEARYAEQCFLLAGRLEDGELDRETIARALLEASSEIDLILQTRYAVPLYAHGPVSPVIRRVCIDIAVGALPRNGATESTAYERRARDARALLASLAKGETSLGADTPPAPAGSSGGGMAYAGPQSDFRRKLDDF